MFWKMKCFLILNINSFIFILKTLYSPPIGSIENYLGDKQKTCLNMFINWVTSKSSVSYITIISLTFIHNLFVCMYCINVWNNSSCLHLQLHFFFCLPCQNFRFMEIEYVLQASWKKSIMVRIKEVGTHS